MIYYRDSVQFIENEKLSERYENRVRKRLVSLDRVSLIQGADTGFKLVGCRTLKYFSVLPQFLASHMSLENRRGARYSGV